jgi:hypothetical protein
MNKLKCARRGQSKGFSIHHDAVLPDQFWILAPDFWLLSRKNIFLEERSQTLPVIIDDREKTNPKRTQIRAKRTQINPKNTPLKPSEPKP